MVGGVFISEFRDGDGFGGVRDELSRSVAVESALVDLAPFRGAGGSGFDFFSVSLSTITQSSSPPSRHGLPFLSGFSFIPSCGGLTWLVTGLSPSNHHFLLSLLAGGRPGAMLW